MNVAPLGRSVRRFAGALLVATSVSSCMDSPVGPAATSANVAAASAQGGEEPQSMAVSPSFSELTPGQTVQLTATITTRNGHINTGRPVKFTSQNPAVATVSAAGLVTAVAPGSTEIVASTNGAKPLTAAAQVVVASNGPLIQIVTPIDGQVMGPGGIVVHFTADDPAAEYDCTIDDQPIPCAIGAGILVDGLSDGRHSFVVQGTNVSGHTNVQTVEFVVDASGPILNVLPAPPASVGQSSTSETEFHFSAVDVSPPITYRCSLDGLVFSDCTDPAGGGGTFRWFNLSDGLHVLRIVAIDDFGNQGPEAQVVFTVVRTP